MKVVAERRARATGTVARVVDNRTDPDPAHLHDAWLTICVDHETVVASVSRSAAHDRVPHPETWCRKCRTIARRRQRQAGQMAAAA